MKIVDVKTYVVEQKLKPGLAFAYSQGWYNSRTILLIKITTNEGVEGWGEAFGPALVNKTIIDKYYYDLLLNRDPLDTQVIWEELYNMFRDHSRQGFSIEALSAIDIALWDIKGKMFNVPIYKLLGGAFREYVVPYATGIYRNELPTQMINIAKEAEKYMSRGFKALKIKIGFGIEDDFLTVQEIRKTVGNDIKLMVDANHAYNASKALQLSRKIEQFDIAWLEEPVPPEDISGYAELKSKSNIPISGGEAEFCRYGFNELLKRRAVDIVQPDCCVTGGISEFQRISTLASIYNIQCYPHIWGSAIAMYAGLHCALSLPNFPHSLIQDEMYYEYDQTPNIFRDELASNGLPINNGLVYPPSGPGLGIVVNEELISRYKL